MITDTQGWKKKTEHTCDSQLPELHEHGYENDFGPMGCVCLYVGIMIPHGKELPEELKYLILRLCK